MICPANISRINGAKSKGPKSIKGKRIASLNASKHGLLATKSPALGEDVLVFQEFMQQLISEFQPESSSEIMLIEQIAMAQLRLRRLWMVEAAIAAHALTPEPPKKPFTTEKYPYYQNDDNEPKFKTLYHPDNRLLERKLSLALLNSVKAYDQLAKDIRKAYFDSIWQEWLDAVEEVVQEFLCKHPSKSVAINFFYYRTESEYVEACQNFVEKQTQSQTLYGEISQLQVSIQMAKQRFNDGKYPKTKKQLGGSIISFQLAKIEEKCKERLKELDKIEQEIQQSEAEHVQAIAEYEELIRRSQAIPPQIELLSRYEKHITRSLYNALDRLKARQQEVSMGSFGQKGE